MAAPVRSTTPPTYEGGVPRTLRTWIERHALGKVYDVTRSGGFSFDNGGVGYDVGITAGYKVNVSGDWLHTVIEPTIKDVISVLKTLTECHECDECRAAWAKHGGGK